MGHWSAQTLEKHLDQHNSISGLRTINAFIGDVSADSTRFIWFPPHNYCEFRRILVHTPTTLSASATAYWSIYISQRTDDGSWADLYKIETSNRALTAHLPQFYPPFGESLVRIDPNLPVYARFVKTGSPANLDDISIQIIWGLR